MDIMRSVAMFLLAFGLDVGICAVLLSYGIDHHTAVYAIIAASMCLFSIVIYGVVVGR